MKIHVFIFAPKYMIITKHVPNTNTRGVNGFSGMFLGFSGMFRSKKKREISAGAWIFSLERGFPNKKKERVHGFLRGL
jgi:hypothetical protein